TGGPRPPRGDTGSMSNWSARLLTGRGRMDWIWGIVDAVNRRTERNSVFSMDPVYRVLYSIRNTASRILNAVQSPVQTDPDLDSVSGLQYCRRQMWNSSPKPKKVIYVVVTDGYQPDVCAHTIPSIQRYAKKIGADLQIISQRKYPGLPASY